VTVEHFARVSVSPPMATGVGWLIRLALRNDGPSDLFAASIVAAEAVPSLPGALPDIPWRLLWAGSQPSGRSSLERGHTQLLRLAVFRPEPRRFVVLAAGDEAAPEQWLSLGRAREVLLTVRVQRGDGAAMEQRVRLSYEPVEDHSRPVVSLADDDATLPLLAEEAHRFGAQDNDAVRATNWDAIPYIRHQVSQLFDMRAYLAAHLAEREQPVALTLACGDMRGEYRFLRNVGITEIDAADLSVGQRDKFYDEVYDGAIPVNYRIADANDIELEAGRYDLVFLQHAYHHIEALEHVADQISRSLKPHGLFAINDYVGANFLQRTPRQRDLCGAIWRAMPERYRIAQSGEVLPELRIPPKESLPPYEAVRSEDILDVLASRFETREMFLYAGILVPLFNSFAQCYTDSTEDQEFLRLIWDLDRWLLNSGLIEPNLMKAIYAPRPRRTG
jgi:SAM-dependent methyltransferase